MFDGPGPLLADAVLRRSFGDDALRRGSAYASGGRVVDMAWSAAERTFYAVVRGSQGRTYRTAVSYDANDRRWWGECSCPVVEDCKHAAAVLLSARATLPLARSSPRLPGWEEALADLVDPAAARHRGTPMGLQFDVAATPPGRRTADVREIRLRPVVPGASGRWVRTGVTWRNLGHDYEGLRDPAHAEALVTLLAAARAADDGRSYYGYGSGDVQVWLEDFGPTLWPALRQAVDVGVSLVTTRGGEVRVAPEPGSVIVDLRRDGDGGVALEPLVELGPELRAPTAAVRLLGSPPHGVALVPDDGALPVGLVPEKGLVLVQVQPVPRRVARLLAGGTLHVPADDAPRFLGAFYPALHSALPVGSSDGSVQLPELHPPEPALRVEHSASTVRG